jgi:RES domain-containing protein
VTHRKLPKARSAFRIGDQNGRHPIFCGKGAATTSGRWHSTGQEVIYCSEHYSTALLERLVYFNTVLPPNQHAIKILIPAGTTYEVCTKDQLPNWHLRHSRDARAFGSAWLSESRSCVLFVPSRVAREEQNVLINPNHSDFSRIEPGLETPVLWDERLFSKG